MSHPLPGWNPSRTYALRFAFIILAVLLFLGGLVLAMVSLFALPADDAARRAAYLGAAGIVVAGILAAAALLWLAEVLQLLSVRVQQGQLAQTTAEQIRSGILLLEQALGAPPVPGSPDAVARTNAAAPRASPPVPAHDDSTPALSDAQALELLRQLRDFALMNDRQRAESARTHWDQRKLILVKKIERAAAAAQWEEALNHVREVQAILPDDPAGSHWAERIGAERSARLQQEMESARSQVRHLMSITAWAQAQDIITALDRKFPGAPEVVALAEQLRRERDAFEADNFQRLMLDLKDATDHRQWNRALMVVEELLQRYAGDKKVERLRLDLPTLRENAEAQERREEEATFKDLLHRQRYEEALVVARRVISKYPATSAATELSKLLPKVEELAGQDQLKRLAQARGA